MIEYNTLIGLKLSNSELDKLKSAITNGNEVTENLSSNVIGDSTDETNYPNKSLLNNRKVSRLCTVFVNNSSANI